MPSNRPAVREDGMMLAAARVTAAAERLWEAAASVIPCPPVRDLIGDDDVSTAYSVQRVNTERRSAAGARLVGRKIGLTSSAVQKQLGVDRPDFGVLFADMEVADSGVVSGGRLLQPKVEAEVAFVLGRDLDDERLDEATVRGAVAHLVAALEIVDSRIAAWDITFGDTVADNASSGLFVLGSQRATLADVEPALVRMAMRVDGDVVSEGSGAACLGDPLHALAWLARTARDLGEPLRAGQVVLSGALGPMAPVAPKSLVQAEISALGSVPVRFS